MQLYLTVNAAHEAEAAQLSRSVAHLCYRVGPAGRLMRNAAPKGGVMVLTDGGEPSFREPTLLTEDILRECRRCRFSGVLADFEMPPADESRRFLTLLNTQLRRAGKRLYVPLRWASLFPDADLLFDTAVSGGSFPLRLRRTARELGARRLALDLRWLRMEFPLPCPDGEGRTLPPEELNALLRREQPVTFFSEPLCARYFTYSAGTEHRFVLYDTEETLLKKLRLASSLGCGGAFLLYSEAEQLPAFLQRIRKERIL